MATASTVTLTAPVSDSLPPHNAEAERAVLGCLITNPAYLDEIPFLHADDFYIVKNGWVFAAMLKIAQRHETPDYMPVVQELETAGQLNKIGGAAYVLGLMQGEYSSWLIENYARIVERLAVRRRIVEAATVMVRLAHSERDVEDVLTLSRRSLDDIADRRAASLTLAPTAEEVTADLMVEAAQRQADPTDVPGMACGLRPLDVALGGFEEGLLYLVSGRPGMGKSALLGTMALGFAEAGAGVLLFALEMGQKAMYRRMICQRAQVGYTPVLRGRISDTELKRYQDAALKVGKLPLFVEPLSGVTVRTLRSVANRYAREKGVRVVMVDTLNCVKPEAGSSQYEKLTDVSRALKDWAHASPYAVIVAAQLNRGVTKQADKRPTLDSLRDSGAQEEDADVVLGLHREFYYTKKIEQEHLAELALLKVREGGSDGRVELFFQAAWPGFAVLEKAAEPPEIARAKAADRAVVLPDETRKDVA